MDASMEVESQNFALITLKERCHFLKQQLKAVDEENIKLKVQIASNRVQKNSDPNLTELCTEVEVLKKQKEQLSNQIHILATENNNMWSRLSRLTVVNRNLTRRYTKIAETLDKYDISSSITEEDIENSITEDNKNYRRNLEQMSLKLINDIKLEKTELEQQYAQMVDIHNNEAGFLDLAFSSVETDEDSILGNVRKHTQRLNLLKQTLKQQQRCLVTCLEELRKSKNKDGAKVVDSRDAATETVEETVRAVPIIPTIESTNLPGQTVVDKEQICPLCGVHIAGTPEQFVDHVSDHFDEETEADVNSFVHIP